MIAVDADLVREGLEVVVELMLDHRPDIGFAGLDHDIGRPCHRLDPAHQGFEEGLDTVGPPRGLPGQ